MEQLSYYGIPHETYLNYIGDLDSREDLKTEVADLQNLHDSLTSKVRDFQLKYSYLDSERYFDSRKL